MDTSTRVADHRSRSLRLVTLAVSTSLTIALASLLVGTASHAASPPSYAHVSAECDTQFDAIAGIGNAAELVTVVAAAVSWLMVVVTVNMPPAVVA